LGASWPIWAPRGRQGAPRGRRDCPRSPPPDPTPPLKTRNMDPCRPKMAQDAPQTPKTPPWSPKLPSKTPQEPKNTFQELPKRPKIIPRLPPSCYLAQIKTNVNWEPKGGKQNEIWFPPQYNLIATLIWYTIWLPPDMMATSIQSDCHLFGV